MILLILLKIQMSRFEVFSIRISSLNFFEPHSLNLKVVYCLGIWSDLSTYIRAQNSINKQSSLIKFYHQNNLDFEVSFFCIKQRFHSNYFWIRQKMKKEIAEDRFCSPILIWVYFILFIVFIRFKTIFYFISLIFQ